MQKIILIHGVCGSKNNFKYLQKELAKYFEIISFDLIGHGRERKPQQIYDAKNFVSFIERRIKFNDQEKYVFVGHSMGAIIAKEFALKHPANVKKIFLVNYPFKKEVILRHWFYRMYSKYSIWGKMMCDTKHIWKYVFYPYFFLFYDRYFDSFQDYFRHTYNSETSSLKNTLLTDSNKTLKKIKKEKLIFISGEKDHVTIKKFIKHFTHYSIKGMGHLFFGFEKEIAQIIRKNV